MKQEDRSLPVLLIGASVLLEVGPRGVLSSMAAGCLSDDAQGSTALIPALRKDKPEVESLLSGLGGLHCHHVAVDWAALFTPHAPRRVASRVRARTETTSPPPARRGTRGWPTGGYAEACRAGRSLADAG